MERDAVMVRLRSILEQHFGKSAASLRPEATLAGALMLDSLDLMDLASLLGRSLDVTPTVDDFRRARSIEGLVALLVERRRQAA